MDDEIWKPIEGFAGYDVSNFGGVRRRMRSWKNRGKCRYRKWCFNSAGYAHVGLGRSGKTVTQLVHLLVARAFLGPASDGMQVNHKNGIKSDPQLSNLEYTTPSGNTIHAYQTGLAIHPRGSDWYSSKLTESNVSEIRRLAASGVAQKDLATQFRVSRPTICEVVNRKAWKHVA